MFHGHHGHHEHHGHHGHHEHHRHHGHHFPHGHHNQDFQIGCPPPQINVIHVTEAEHNRGYYVPPHFGHTESFVAPTWPTNNYISGAPLNQGEAHFYQPGAPLNTGDPNCYQPGVPRF